MKKIALLLLALLFIAFNAYTQNITPVWASTFGGLNWDIATSISINPKNGLMVSGKFLDSIYINNQIFYSKGLGDVYVVSYDFNGNIKDAFTYGGESNDFAQFGAYNGQSVLVSKHYGDMEMLGKKYSSVYNMYYLVSWFDNKGKITDQSIIEGVKGLTIKSMVSEPSGAVQLAGWFHDEMKVDDSFFSAPKTSTGTPFLITLKKNGKQKEVLKGDEALQGHVYAMCKGKGNELHVAGISGEENDPNWPRIAYRKMYVASIGSNGKLYNYKNLIKGIELEPVSIQSFNGYLWVASKFRHYCIYGTDTLKAFNDIDILMVRINQKNGQTEAWTINGHTRCIPLNLTVSNDQLILSGNFSHELWFGNKYIKAAPNGCDIFLLAFEDSPEPVSSLVIGGVGNDFPCDVQTYNNSIYVLGQFKDTINIAGKERIPVGSYDILLASCDNKIPRSKSIELAKSKGSSPEVPFQLYPSYTSALVYWVPGTGYPENGAMLWVSDILGKTHLQIDCKAIHDPCAVQTLDLSKLSRGVYMVNIQGDNYEKTIKVIKE